MKQTKKQTEVKQMEPIKTGKTISLRKYNMKRKNEEGEDVDEEVEITKFFLVTILNFRPDKEKHPEWGMSMEEILERKELRKNLDSIHPDSTVVEITNEQAKILLSAMKMIDWRVEDEPLIELYNALK